MAELTRREWLKRVGGGVALLSLASCRNREIRYLPQVSGKIVSAYHPVSEIGCIACENCMPCPYGIDIPSNLLFVDEARRKDYLPEESSDSDFELKGRKFLAKYDDEISPQARAQKCIGCGKCLGLCPMNIIIPSRMMEIAALTDLLRNIQCQES